MSSRAEKKAFRFSTSCLQIVQNYHKETPFLSGTIRVQSGRQKRESPHLRLLSFPRCHAGKIHAQAPAAGAAPLKKHCPPANARQQPRRRTDYQQPPNSRKCLGVLIHRQRRFLLLSTALSVFVLQTERSKKSLARLVRGIFTFYRRSRRRSAGREARSRLHAASRLSLSR